MNGNTVKLECTELAWVNGPEDDPNDQCAHSRIRFTVGDVDLISPTDGNWTVSASALYLLRTLEHDHQPESGVTDGNQLFPCCGFTAIPQNGDFRTVFFGCPSGLDVWISTSSDVVTLESDGNRVEVTKDVWVVAVLQFVKSVRDFYDVSTPKVIIDDEEERQGWNSFWSELTSRYDRATS